MSSRYFAPLTERQFQQLVEVAEANGGTGATAGQQAAGSFALELFNGDEVATERHLWGSWEYLVGGEPFKRNADAVNGDAARFLIALITVCSGDRNEQPPVVRLPRRAAA